jgi:hypothetical protein
VLAVKISLEQLKYRNIKSKTLLSLQPLLLVCMAHKITTSEIKFMGQIAKYGLHVEIRTETETM